MKTLLTSLLIAYPVLIQAQTPTQLGNKLSPNVSHQSEIEILFNNLGTPFVTFINAGDNLKMKKLINNDWVDASSSLSTISSSVDEFDISYNSTSNEFFIVYIRNDSMFLRTYNSTWSTETFVSPAFNAHVETCIDEESADAYFIYKRTDYIGEIQKYSMSNSTFESIPLPTDIDQYASSWYSIDIKFNPLDDKLYLSGNIYDSYYTQLRRYNGSTWEQFPSTIGQWNGTNSSRIIIDTARFYDISVMISLPTNNGYSTIGKKYRNELLGNYSNLQNSFIFDLYDHGSIRSFVKNKDNGHYAYLYTNYDASDSSRIRFTDHNSWFEFNHGLGSNALTAMNFRDNGKMLVCSIDPFNDLYVYEYEKYTASVPNNDKISDINIYPNPASSQLTISNSSDWKDFEVLDAKGSIVKVGTSNLESSTTVDLGDLESGIYFLNIITANSYITKKFIIK